VGGGQNTAILQGDGTAAGQNAAKLPIAPVEWSGSADIQREDRPVDGAGHLERFEERALHLLERGERWAVIELLCEESDHALRPVAGGAVHVPGEESEGH